MDVSTSDRAAAGASPTGASPAGFTAAGWRWGWLFAAIWLVYLVDPLRDAARADGWPRRVAGVLSVVLFGVLYVRAWVVSRRVRRLGGTMSVRNRAVLLAASAACVVVAAATAGESALAMLVFVATIVMFVLPTRPAVALVAVLVGIVLVVPRLVPGWTPQNAAAGGIAFAALAMFGILSTIRRNAELVAAQRELAALAIVGERSRFARDLHDILGHSLTVVAVKAELAGRLVGVDDEKARAEIADVERLAREALADVRTAVTGYREVTLVSELVSARAALDAAGIEAEVPTAVQDVPADRRELFGWAVREGVTNVVRHSRARRCTITVAADAVEVVDDGPGAAGGATAGPGSGARSSGLAGLRERAAAQGADVLAEAGPGGFRLRVGW